MLPSLELNNSLWILLSSGKNKRTLKNWMSLVSEHKEAPLCYIHIWTAQERCCSYCGVKSAEGLFFISHYGRDFRKILQFLTQKCGLLA